MYDSTDFVNASIHEVAVTLVEALVIVMLVIFAFLGSPRSVLIPVIAIPLSLVGTLGDHAGPGILDQSADSARAGAGDRSRGGRRHHRGRERQSALGGRHGAARRGDAGGARARHGRSSP